MTDLPAHIVDRLLHVEVPTGGTGCGVLLTGNVVLTCHHILPTRIVVRAAIARVRSSVIRFDANRFWTDETLDCAMVEIAGSSVAVDGVADLVRPAVGDDLVIVQVRSPRAGGPCLRSIRVTAVTGPFVYYPEPTPYGCSGAPLFNKEWRLVAIHQSRSYVRGPDGRAQSTGRAVCVEDIVNRREGRLKNGLSVGTA